MTELPDLSRLSHDEKDALIRALWAQVQALTARVAELEARLGLPPKTPDNSSVPPSAGQKANRGEKPRRQGPRKGSLGRKGGGRALVETPDKTVIARPMCCAHCQAALEEADRKLAARYDKVDLPPVRPVVTRVERYAGECRHCGRITLAPVPEGLEPGTPFSLNVVALAIYLRVVHAISYRRLSRLMLELLGLAISEGALDAAFRRAMPGFDAEVGAILARLRRARVVCSDGRKHCFRRGAHRRAERLELGVPERRGGDPRHPPQPRRRRRGRGDGRAPAGDLGLRPLRGAAGACRGMADLPGASASRLPVRYRGGGYGLRPAHEDAVAAGLRAGPATTPSGREHPAQLPTAIGTRARCHHAACPCQPAWPAPAKALGKLRSHLFTFLNHPEVGAENNGSERELRPTATYRKVTGGFRSVWAANFFAAVRSIIGTATRRGIDAYQAVKMVLQGQSVLAPP